MATPEHILQLKLKKTIRDIVTARHEFLSFDRTKASGMFTHAREGARGIRKGTSDTLLKVVNFPGLWCEVKRPGLTPSDTDETWVAQQKFGRDMIEVGDRWFWVNSIVGYVAELRALHIPIVANAEYQAMMADAWVLSEIAKATTKRTVARRDKPEPRYTASKSAARRWAKAGIIAG